MKQKDTPSIVILTGAGISKESGLSTFRDADGIWARVNIEDVATPEAYARDPVGVQAFYNERRAKLASGSVQPNPAHGALARLEAEWPGDVVVVTQNIDDLHRRAGSQNVIHMHGELLKVHCSACGDVQDWQEDVSVEQICDACGAHGTVRPHVVWFGEMPYEMDKIGAALDACGLFLSIGTSGNVYPAAGFVAHVRDWARTVELNLEPSEGASLFTESHHGLASEVVPAFVDAILRKGG